jgi:hypothetical protein
MNEATETDRQRERERERERQKQTNKKLQKKDTVMGRKCKDIRKN